jgi:16S rRNA processing protein RimM
VRTGPGGSVPVDDRGADRVRVETVDGQGFLVLGRVSGPHGVKGWVRVHSDTSPRENIVKYTPWYLVRQGRRQAWAVTAGRLQGKTVVAKLDGCDDRDCAEGLAGAQIAVARSQLPVTAPGEFYWADLLGLAVSTVDGVELGRIEDLLETGANDVMVVRGGRERLVPYVWQQVVVEVDLDRGRMVVDWDPDF